LVTDCFQHLYSISFPLEIQLSVFLPDSSDLPLVYMISILWVLGGLIFNYNPETPIWLLTIGFPAYFLTIALLPVYIVWVVFSKRLTVREKWWWPFIVIIMNMIGMPWFYIFIFRRYLGIKTKTNSKDEKALEKFLQKNKINHENLSLKQKNVLRAYCRKRRLQSWALFLFFLSLPFQFIWQ